MSKFTNSKEIKWPKQATHIRLYLAKDKKTTVLKQDVETIIGVDYERVEFLWSDKKAKKLKVCASEPEATPAKADAPVAAPATGGGKNTAATTSGSKPRTKVDGIGKMAFIVKLAEEKESGDISKHTAREVAEKVVKAFPDAEFPNTKDGNEEELAKALRFVRAVPWHMKQAGKKAIWKKAASTAKPKLGKNKADAPVAATDAAKPTEAKADEDAPIKVQHSAYTN